MPYHEQQMAETKSLALRDEFDDQEEIFRDAFLVLQQAISDQVFPTASVAVTHQGRLVALKAMGHFTYDASSPASSVSTRFDVASLTKVVATTSMAMTLYQRGLVNLEAPVASIVPEFLYDEGSDPRRREVTLRMLLAHSSGLPAYVRLFQQAHSRDELLQAAFTTALIADPSTHAEYSDIGFIILGVALERLANETLEAFCRGNVFAPLGMKQTDFNPSRKLGAQIPPTADDRTFRKRIIQGEVQDENAFVLGGVAGHAGLFSTARDMARFGHCMIEDGRPVFQKSTIDLFTKREGTPTGTSRALGWDTPSAPSQSGRYFGSSSFGHLGYTGTSLWIDPREKLSIILLTNRTWPHCANQNIKTVRPRFHDAVMEGISKNAK